MSSSCLRRIVTLSVTIILGGVATFPARSAGQIAVTVNGNSVNLSPPPIARDGRLFVPLRGVFENLLTTP